MRVLAALTLLLSVGIASDSFSLFKTVQDRKAPVTVLVLAFGILSRLAVV